MNKEAQWLLQEKYGGTESEAFRADLALLTDGTPLAYLIGSAPFLNCTVYLDSHPLIPRVETEYWTEKAIFEIRSVAPAAPRILDLCAGSGAIGVAVAKALPAARIDFVELDPAHLSTIQKNLQENIPDYSNRMEYYQIVQSDLFQKLPSVSPNLKTAAVLYDFILTNPPYIDPALDRTEPSVTLHEPHHALYGGTAGMELIEKIIAGAPAHLTPQGQLWIEHEPEQVAAIAALAGKNGFSCHHNNDQYNTPRYSVLSRTVAK